MEAYFLAIFRGLSDGYVALGADISVTGGRQVKVHRISAAIDCGLAVNPNIVRAQVEGGLVFGLSAAFFGEITLDNGAVRQSNFHDYRLVTMAQMPQVDVVIVKRDASPPASARRRWARSRLQSRMRSSRRPGSACARCRFGRTALRWDGNFRLDRRAIGRGDLLGNLGRLHDLISRVERDRLEGG